MKPFELIVVGEARQAQELDAKAQPGAVALRAGGIDLMDRLKEGLDAPTEVVALVQLGKGGKPTGLSELHGVETKTVELPAKGSQGGQGVSSKRLVVGALTTVADLGRAQLPPGLEALQMVCTQIATPSIRNRATVGGNLLQRPRCWYFRNQDLVCLKKGGSVCLAVDGDNRYHAILGGGPSYIVHPSSLAGPLSALGAELLIESPQGQRRVALSDFFVTPKQDLGAENVLRPGELVVQIEIPTPPPGASSAYFAAREKQSHDWPLAEASVSVRMEGKALRDVSVVLGHVAPIPWRSTGAEDALEGKTASPAVFAEAAEAALTDASTLSGNAYKIPLTKGVLRHALHLATNTPLPE